MMSRAFLESPASDRRSSSALAFSRRGASNERQLSNAVAQTGRQRRVERVDLEDQVAEEAIAPAVGRMEGDRVAHREGRGQRAHAVRIAQVEVRTARAVSAAARADRRARTWPGRRTTCPSPAATQPSGSRSLQGRGRTPRFRCWTVPTSAASVSVMVDGRIVGLRDELLVPVAESRQQRQRRSAQSAAAGRARGRIESRRLAAIERPQAAGLPACAGNRPAHMQANGVDGGWIRLAHIEHQLADGRQIEQQRCIGLVGCDGAASRNGGATGRKP